MLVLAVLPLGVVGAGLITPLGWFAVLIFSGALGPNAKYGSPSQPVPMELRRCGASDNGGFEAVGPGHQIFRIDQAGAQWSFRSGGLARHGSAEDIRRMTTTDGVFRVWIAPDDDTPLVSFHGFHDGCTLVLEEVTARRSHLRDVARD
ncbi:hypothetical protein KUV47_05930 [Vannielia litorea]|uniref:hypothetical protein n=1 Tax=Vannielia litorea TaxID=1217970 RepID=UPI001C97F3A1|nr:hypothetical protein [Vannielia litorea]MBY6152743.1 hypothetical protein [Vannielia litorea]